MLFSELLKNASQTSAASSNGTDRDKTKPIDEAIIKEI